MSLAVAKQVLSSDMTRHVKPTEPQQGTNVIIIDIHSEDEEQAVTTPAALTLIPAGTNVRKNYKITKKGKKTIRTPMMSRGWGGLPNLPANPSMAYTFRYSTTDDGTAVVTVADIARSMVAAAGEDKFRYIFRTVKVDRVSIRGMPGAIGGSSTVRLRWLGENTNEITHMASSMSIDRAATISLPPPKLSLASFWHDVTNLTDDEKPLFTVTTENTSNGTCFVDLRLRVIFDEARYISYSIQNNTLSGLSDGGIYYGALAIVTGTVPDFRPLARKFLGI